MRFSKPITQRSNRNSIITFESRLKTGLIEGSKTSRAKSNYILTSVVLTVESFGCKTVGMLFFFAFVSFCIFAVCNSCSPLHSLVNLLFIFLLLEINPKMASPSLVYFFQFSSAAEGKSSTLSFFSCFCIHAAFLVESLEMCVHLFICFCFFGFLSLSVVFVLFSFDQFFLFCFCVCFCYFPFFLPSRCVFKLPTTVLRYHTVSSRKRR